MMDDSQRQRAVVDACRRLGIDLNTIHNRAESRCRWEPIRYIDALEQELEREKRKKGVR